MLSIALRVFQLRLPKRLARPLCLPRSHSCRVLSTMGTIGAQTVNTTDRLVALRKLMTEHNIDTYVVPSEDQREHSGVQGLSDRGSTQLYLSFQIPASTLRSVINGGRSYPDSMALLVRLLLGSKASLLILILCRHCDRNKGPRISFYGWALLSSGGTTA